MTTHWLVGIARLGDLERIAELVALKVRLGDVIALHGDLGAGKTTFARALIRALLNDADAEVPSPTFPIVQSYATARLEVAHFDLYRLTGPDELEEVGFHDATATGLAVVEWPGRAGDALPAERLDVRLAAGPDADSRQVALTAVGSWEARIERLKTINTFLTGALPHGAVPKISYLQGDASSRAYARLAHIASGALVLMDAPRMPDGPVVANGLPYSRIAHLAEDVRPFVAVGTALAATGIAVPKIYATNLDAGLLLLEDLGDQTFGQALRGGQSQSGMIAAAVDVLVHLRGHPLPRDLPLPDGSVHRLARFDRAALEIEIGLLLDWYWPAVKDTAPSPAERAEFMALWSPILDTMLAAPAGLFLRDYHSPNLFWWPERAGIDRIGVIDFQDALAEAWAYDLVSVLQDARVDVPASIEAREIDRYCREMAAREPGFDPEAFRALYAAFGAQRNTRLVGLWVRLLRRDGKPGYLQHMPRTWDYLARNLTHPDLAALKAWYDRQFPEAVRKATITA
ncbi:MAG: tRNA (adenosine(37)-N6)-threonylcarbamoyltransferase complex ATPase subunit type 1 TsaE [Hyphomicrobiaceae bacterium]